MNKLLLSAVLLGLAAPAVAGAAPVVGPSVTGTVNVSGLVAPRCEFTTAGTPAITIAELSDTTTGEFKSSTVDNQQVTLTGWCNGTGSTMSVHADPLLNAVAAPSANFSNRIDFTATATANSLSTSRSSTLAGNSTGVNVGTFTGNILVALSASASNPALPAILVAGGYSGDVIVTLTPST